MEHHAPDPRITRDGVETLAELLDAEAWLRDEPLPERAGLIGQGGQVGVEHEDDVVGRLANRAQQARQQPPHVSEWIEDQPRASLIRSLVGEGVGAGSGVRAGSDYLRRLEVLVHLLADARRAVDRK